MVHCDFWYFFSGRSSCRDVILWTNQRPKIYLYIFLTGHSHICEWNLVIVNWNGREGHVWPLFSMLSTIFLFLFFLSLFAWCRQSAVCHVNEGGRPKNKVGKREKKNAIASVFLFVFVTATVERKRKRASKRRHEKGKDELPSIELRNYGQAIWTSIELS